MLARNQVDRTLIIPNTGSPCGLCNGIGYRIFKRPDGIAVSTRCKCLRDKIERQRYEFLMKESMVGDMTHMRFDAYNPLNPTQERALNVIGSSEHRGWYIFGPYGTGKTHLMTATVLRALKMGISSAIITVPRLLDSLRQYGERNVVELEDAAQTVPYLVLDDLGKHKITDWTQERLFMLIDERYKMYISGRGHTSVSSNHPPEGLERIMDPAIVDRIVGMCTAVFIDGKSYRRQ